MSLTGVSVFTVAKKQYRYKLKAYNRLFNSLIIMQLVAILFSFSGQSRGMSMNHIWMTIHYYSADIMIGFTMLWGFIIAIQLTSRGYKDMNFTFVNNRMTNHLSNLFFLLTASIIGGVTAFLSGYLLKVMIYLFTDRSMLIKQDLAAPSEVVIGMSAAILFILLCCALGYLIGSIVQLHPVFIVLLPVLFIGLLFLANLTDGTNMMIRLFEFYFLESRFFMFVLKGLITSVVLYGAGMLVFNRLEVRT